MIKSAETATRVDELVRAAYKSLNESIRTVQATEDEETFRDYRRRAAYVIAGLYEHILHDLWGAFPELEPEDMRRDAWFPEAGKGEGP
jgi:hypothetical protein